MRNLYDELFGFRREFDEMFNRILNGKPWVEQSQLQLPAYTREFNFTPAVESYVDKEAKKYVCHVTLPGIEPKELADPCTGEPAHDSRRAETHSQHQGSRAVRAGSCVWRVREDDHAARRRGSGETDRRVRERRARNHGSDRRGSLAAEDRSQDGCASSRKARSRRVSSKRRKRPGTIRSGPLFLLRPSSVCGGAPLRFSWLGSP